jgi:hypothetical protein
MWKNANSDAKLVHVQENSKTIIFGDIFSPEERI